MASLWQSYKFRWWLWLLPFWAATWVYGSALGLPFYSDDIQILAYTDQHSLVQMFTQPPSDALFYRPLANVFFKLLPAEPSLWHFSLLALHWLNIALVGALTRRLDLGRWGTAGAMLFYALFPFSAQAVLWVAAFYHLAPATLILCACLCALHASEQPPAQAQRWLMLAGVCASLAPWFIESGVLASLLVLSVLVGRYGWQVRHHLRQALVWLLPALLSTGAFLLIRTVLLSALERPDTLNAPLSEKLAFNLPYLLQGATLPAQWLTKWLTGEPILLVWLGVALYVLVLGLLVWWGWGTTARWRTHFLSLTWVGALMIPNIIGLHPAYLAYSERTLYLASAGIAWGIIAVVRRVPYKIGAGILLVTVILCASIVREYVSVLWIQGRAYQDLSRDLGALSIEDAAQSRLMLVNLPTHIEQITPYAPLSRVHASILSDWVPLDDFLARLSGRRFAQADHYYVPAVFPSLAGFQQGAYWSHEERPYEVHELPERFAEYAAVVIAQLTPQGYSLRLVGQQAPASTRLYGNWGAIRLLDVQALWYGTELRLALTWQKTEALSPDIVPFVQLVCDGSVRSQADGEALGGYYGFHLWANDERWTDYRLLNWHDGDCLLKLGLYARSTGERLLERVTGEDVVVLAIQR